MNKPADQPEADTEQAIYHVTFFPDFAAGSKKHEALTPWELRQKILNTRAKRKDKLPWLKLAKFGDKKSEAGCLRYDANMKCFCGVEGDYDGGKISFDEACDIIRKARLHALVYMSPSGTVEKPRWRVLCPTSEDLPTEQRARLMARLNGLFGGAFGSESFTASQSYYYGGLEGNSAHACNYYNGDFIDRRKDLDAGAIGKKETEAKEERDQGGDQAETAEPPQSFDELIAKLRTVKKTRNKALNKAAFLCGQMVGTGKLTESDAAAALLDAALATGLGSTEAKRTIKSGLNAGKQNTPTWVAELNREYAVTLVGGDCKILKEGADDFQLMGPQAFTLYLKNKTHTFKDEEGSKVKQSAVADLWLKHKHRRTYDGIIFDPRGDRPGFYNVWKGWSYEPNDKKGSCSLFRDHILLNVCNGDDKLYDWVMGWFAQMFQKPADKPGTSLCFRGEMGSGKTIVGKIIGDLCDTHRVGPLAKPEAITGRFNQLMKACLFLHADEAFFAGDHRAASVLKDLVTSDVMYVEPKNVDMYKVDNYIRLFISGNAEWQVPAGMDERRFAVLDVGNGKKQNTEYFAAIQKQMDDGGYEALLHYLLTFDLSQVDLRKIPQTDALLDQKLASLTPEQSWWFDFLHKGALPWGSKTKNTTPADNLFARYVEHADQTGVRRKAMESKLGKFLNKHCPGVIRHREGSDQVRVYTFPPLKDCRKAFEERLQQVVEWDGGLNDWDGGLNDWGDVRSNIEPQF